ncbi:hypothetical protein [Zavarzinella formosa]|uniref:hypothetical protein n=1 Tax=Zavarzinella formosa TaxID=360055 RepID=UPI000372EC36|nr:hypothetical protein [Zavarzinella formosa]
MLDNFEEFEQKNPLVRFSWYLNGRIFVLNQLSSEIIENLNKAWPGKGLCVEFLQKAESQLWFWTLGAYEMIRTMDQAKTCFSCRLHPQLLAVKNRLSTARMPAAKMEVRSKKTPIASDRSPCDFDNQNRDLLIGDPENPVSGRDVLKEFSQFISSIRLEDILKRHEDSYC